MSSVAAATLPIDAHVPDITRAFSDAGNLVLVAEPGAGKTTRVPRALLEAGFAQQGEIVVLEPRRIAARMAAARVASELGEPVGKRVGYQVRFEERASSATRVRFVTEGVLTRKLIAEPGLPGIACVVLDEFHERHLHGDLALALMRRLQRSRRQALSLCVMSATLDAAPVARFLDAPVLEVPGRRFEVLVEYADKPDERPLADRVALSLRRLLREQHTGDVLVFLPGAAEIRKSADALGEIARRHDLELCPLHGDLPAREQDRAVAPSPRRKVILSTNVAESSLTIEGVTTVIDSGLARVAGHSPWSGLPTLVTGRISRASAQQRAGRAGRVRAGRCVRLYTRADYDDRPLHDTPEIARADLSEVMLALSAAERPLQPDEFYQAPPAEAWRAAEQLLRELGALEPGARRLSELGQRMLALPMHPRLSRIVLEAHSRGVGRSGALVAALLSERDVALESRTRFDRGAARARSGPSDVLDRLDRFLQVEGRGYARDSIRNHELDAGGVVAVRRVWQRLLSVLGNPEDTVVGAQAHDEALGLSLLSGYGDRVAKRRRRGGSELSFARGGSCVQAEHSVVREAEFVVVLDAAEQHGKVVARLSHAIEPEWLLELFPDAVEDIDTVRFDAQRERVFGVRALRYGALVLDESRARDPDPEQAARVLAEAVRARGLSRVLDLAPVERFERRLAFAAEHSGEVSAAAPDSRERALELACRGKLALSDITTEALLAAFRGQLSGAALAALERVAPDSVTLARGRRVRVHYEADRPPWIASRLQDFFGMREAPRVGGKPLTLHLLAPNQRAVQVTTDLAGFWQRHYPELRKRLMRRYPKHDWREHP